MLVKMRLNTPTTLCLLAVSVANALPAPQDDAATATLPIVASKDTSVALGQLAQLADFASENTKEALGADSTQKRGLCTPSKLSVRREWSVVIRRQ